MKILWLCSWYPNEKAPFDGDFIERHARALAMYQPVDVIHFVQNTELLRQYEFQKHQTKSGAVTTTICHVPYPELWIKPLQPFVFNRRYLYLLKKEIRKYIQQQGKPDVIHLHVPVKMGAGALWIKKKWNIPFAVTEHSSSYFDFISRSYPSRNYYFRFITRKSFEEASVVSSVSCWLLNRLNDLFTIKTTYLIRNAVDTTLFFSAKKDHSVKRFIHVSMMEPLKNAEGMIAALQQLKQKRSDWEMVFAGPASNQMKQKAKDAGLDKQIRWTGVLSYQQVAKEMQQADALIHFSKYENLPCVINEALCCGLPVISSDVGGIAELIHSSNGILVENENITALANAMNQYLDKPDIFSADQIANEARNLFSYETIGKQLVEMYRNVLAKG